MNLRFENKIVWITGASSGIGFALAKQFAEQHATVILSGRSIETLEIARLKLDRAEKHFSLVLDLEKSDNFSALTQLVIEKMGRIDVLVNNGGISQRSEVHETAIEIDRKIMEVNYFGNIALTKAVLPFFSAQKSGTIIVISSIAGKFGFYLRSAYAASKHALQGFYESLLLEEAKNNLKITLVYPGKINTDISKNALNSAGKRHGVMDHNQATGMDADVCAKQIINGVAKGKKELLIGNKEIKAVILKRFFPWLFWRIIAKQKAI
jgi:dehydrogenase/reductase SDR family member 7B